MFANFEKGLHPLRSSFGQTDQPISFSPLRRPLRSFFSICWSPLDQARSLLRFSNALQLGCRPMQCTQTQQLSVTWPLPLNDRWGLRIWSVSTSGSRHSFHPPPSSSPSPLTASGEHAFPKSSPWWFRSSYSSSFLSPSIPDRHEWNQAERYPRPCPPPSLYLCGGQVMRINQSCYGIHGSVHLQSCFVHINTTDYNAYKANIWIVLEVFFTVHQTT